MYFLDQSSQNAKIIIFVCTKSKAEFFIFLIFLRFLVANIHRSELVTFGFRILSSFSDFFRLFERKLRACYLSSIFYQGHVILFDRSSFRVIFFALSSFVFTMFTFHVVSRTVLKFHCTQACSFMKKPILHEV